MATELINRITIKKDGVYVSTHSSNDNAPYHSVRIKSLSGVYKDEGQRGLDREVIRMLYEYASLRGNHHSLKRYYYALNSSYNDKVYKKYTDKINNYYDSLTEEDKKTIWSLHKTENAEKYHEYQDYMRNEMYKKMAYKCYEYDLINERTNNYQDKDVFFNHYQELISTILEVSDEYNVDFNSRTPFQDFCSDEDASYGTMYSFSNYYKDILEKFNVKVESILTDNWSDGKYKITINNNNIFDIKAWDGIDSVIDNVESMIEILKNKESEMSYE